MAVTERLMRWDMTSIALATVIKGADVALRLPVIRDVFVDALIKHLRNAYRVNEVDEDKLRHIQFLGPCLEPFLHRLINERPAAARSVLRFLGTWIQDMHMRVRRLGAGHVAPCTVVIEPTDRCNLHCPGCYAKSSCDGSDLPYDLMESIVQEMANLGVSLVTISGGEPFLREQADRTLTRLGRKFNNRGFLVYTNGTLIDDAIARRMGEVGNIYPCISVEGFERQTDHRRGKGVYQRDREVRSLLGRYGVMTGFSATLTRENCDAICTDEFIERRIDEGDLVGWFFLLQPIGRSPRPDLMVTSGQRAKLRETIWRWRREKRPIFLGDFWNDGHLTGGCIAGGAYYFHIYANGDISPCVFSPISCGNILDIIAGKTPYKNLEDFIARSPVFMAFRKEQEGIKDRDRPCLLIDHPEAARRICRLSDCRPAKNMAPGYLDGEIAATIENTARDWARQCESLEPTIPPVDAQEPQQPRKSAAAR